MYLRLCVSNQPSHILRKKYQNAPLLHTIAFFCNRIDIFPEIIFGNISEILRKYFRAQRIISLMINDLVKFWDDLIKSKAMW